MRASLNQHDLHFLGLALNEAEKALPLSHPNPAVGCVIVSPSGKVIATGYTQNVGGPHAEAMALDNAVRQGASLKGASVYVTLEPCAHHGRTPPCANALVNARVGRVVALLQDPNPLVAGGGFTILQNAGIETLLIRGNTPEEKALIDRAEDQMSAFLHRMRHKRPWTRLKTAASLDGFTALANGQSQWITGEEARQDNHLWRARAGFIVTGIGTILADAPQLNVRLPLLQQDTVPHQPHLAILDRNLRTPLPHEWTNQWANNAGFWNTLRERQCLIFCDALTFDSPQNQTRIAALQQAGATVLPIAQQDSPLEYVQQTLFERGANEFHVEAGAILSGAWIQAQIVDELLLYLAPKLLASGKPMFNLPALRQLDSAQALHIFETQSIGKDVRIRAYFQAP